jgi:hypothetical protein
MKITPEKPNMLPLNTFSLAGISLLWGQMLGMINPWFTILTVLCIMIGYGSEINSRKVI